MAVWRCGGVRCVVLCGEIPAARPWAMTLLFFCYGWRRSSRKVTVVFASAGGWQLDCAAGFRSPVMAIESWVGVPCAANYPFQVQRHHLALYDFVGQWRSNCGMAEGVADVIVQLTKNSDAGFRLVPVVPGGCVWAAAIQAAVRELHATKTRPRHCRESRRFWAVDTSSERNLIFSCWISGTRFSFEFWM